MDLGAYLRVSGSEQAKRATSIPFQLEVIESYCLRNGHRVVASYADEGVSGMSMNRPGLNRLLHDAEAGKFQAVITQDMTRWGRATEGIMVTQRLRDVGIRVIFASEGYGDTDDPYASEFNEDIGTAVAKKHVSDLAKFTPGRMVNGVLKGGKGIGGQPPFGYSAQYQVGSDGQPIVMNGRAVTKLVPNDHAPVVLKAFELYASGGSTRDVASLLRPERGLVMQASSVTRLLTNCRYYGANVIGKKQARKQRSGGTRTKYMPRETWTIRPHMHEPIVSKELFDQVQARLSSMSRSGQRSRSQAKFNFFPQGLVRCASCGSVVELHKSAREGFNTTYTYLCRRVRSLGLSRNENPGCEGSIHFEVVRKAVLARIARLVEGDDLQKLIDNYKPKADPEIAALEKQLAKAEKTLANYVDAIGECGGSTVLLTALAKAEKTVSETKAALHIQRALQPVTFDPSTLKADAWTIMHSLNWKTSAENPKAAASIEMVRALVGKLFVSIRVDLRAAKQIRDAHKTLDAKKVGKPKQRVQAEKIAAAEVVDRLTFSGGPIRLQHPWEPSHHTSLRLALQQPYEAS